MLANSANATRARIDYERRRSSRQRQSIIRQVEKICEESDNDSNDDDCALNRYRSSKNLKSKTGKKPITSKNIRKSRRGSSRYSLARRLKAQQDSSGNGGKALNLAVNTNDTKECTNLKLLLDFNQEQSSRTRENEKTIPRPLHIYNIHPWFILLPQNRLRIGWDILMAFILSCLAFYIPYRVCLYWDDNSKSTGVFWFELSTDIVFGVDLMMNFTYAYYDPNNNQIVTIPSKIAVRYLKGYFLLDLIATIPIGYIFSDDMAFANKIGKLGRLPKMMKFLRAIRLLKLLRMYKLQKLISKMEVEYNIHHGIPRMIKIIVMVLLVTHLAGCFWYLVGVTGGEDDIDGGWIYRFSFHERPTEAKYVASLYWAFSTLTTVGYGDISARTPQEQSYSMLMMLLGVSWYAYVVSSMSTVMASFDAQRRAVREKMVCVNEFVRAARLPVYLAKQVKDFFEFKLTNSQRAFLLSGKEYDADELLYELSSGLRTDVLLFMDRELVKKIPFFQDKVPQFVADTITMFQPMFFQENDFIVKEGTQADEMFFLIKGSAGVYYGSKKVKTMSEGCYFGEIGCLMGGIRRASIKAESECELQALSRRNLNVLLSEYPDVADELKQVAKTRNNIVKTQNTKTIENCDAEHLSSSREDKIITMSDSEHNEENTKIITKQMKVDSKLLRPNCIADNETNQSDNKEFQKGDTTNLKNAIVWTKQVLPSSSCPTIQKLHVRLNRSSLYFNEDFCTESLREIESFLKSHLTMEREKAQV